MRRIDWNYGQDLVTVKYDATNATPARLAKAIVAIGYEVEVAGGGPPDKAQKRRKWLAPVPADAPKFFSNAFAKARTDHRPMLVGFWASWCAPCIQLKEVTFASEVVAKLLSEVEVVFVDLDRYPALGKAYEVDSVPNVLLIDTDGMVVSRLRNYERPDAFAERLSTFLWKDSRSLGIQKKQTKPKR